MSIYTAWPAITEAEVHGLVWAMSRRTPPKAIDQVLNASVVRITRPLGKTAIVVVADGRKTDEALGFLGSSRCCPFVPMT